MCSCLVSLNLAVIKLLEGARQITNMHNLSTVVRNKQWLFVYSMFVLCETIGLKSLMTVFTKHPAHQKQLTIRLWHTSSTTYGLIKCINHVVVPGAWKRSVRIFTSHWSILFSAPPSQTNPGCLAQRNLFYPEPCEPTLIPPHTHPRLVLRASCGLSCLHHTLLKISRMWLL